MTSISDTVQVDAALLTRKLCSMMKFMTTPAEIKTWFSSRLGRRVTATDIAEALSVSRNTANSRLSDGLDAGDTITVSRHFGINPVEALVELGHLTYEDAFSFVDSDGTMLTTATQEQLIRQLAEDSLSLSDRIEIGAAAKALADRRDELAARRAEKSHDRVPPRPTPEHDGTVRDFDREPGTYAADSSINEGAAREERGEDPID